MKTALLSLGLLCMTLTWGCSSPPPSHNSGMMAMHCSKCDADLKSDTTMKCKCGNDVKVGDLNVKCPKCGAEAKLADCHGTCTKCGADMSQADCKVKCPKCGGEADAKAVCCPRCAADMKK